MSCNCKNNVSSTLNKSDCDICDSNSCDPCNQDPCGCKYTLSSACTLYEGTDFRIIEAFRGDSIEKVLQKVDSSLFQVFSSLTLGIANKEITDSYVVTIEDNNNLIVVDNGVEDIQIDLGDFNAVSYFHVQFIQKGTGLVTFINYDIKPDGFLPSLAGQGHISELKIVSDTRFITGSLLPE